MRVAVTRADGSVDTFEDDLVTFVALFGGELRVTTIRATKTQAITGVALMYRGTWHTTQIGAMPTGRDLLLWESAQHRAEQEAAASARPAPGLPARP